MEASALYLELLKKALLRSDQFAPPSPIRMRDWRRFIVSPVQRALQRRGYEITPARLPEYALGETMIGRARLDNIQFCIESVLDDEVAGDLIETGVGKGGATIFMRAVLAVHGVTDRTVWAADSYEGFPEVDDGFTYTGELGDLATLPVAGLEQVQANFDRYGLLDERVRFLKGWFSETLPSAPIEKIAVLRLDGDRYDSTCDALGSLEPRVSAGGYVIVDDYGAFLGCRRAIDDYRERNSITAPLEWVDYQAVMWRKPSP